MNQHWRNCRVEHKQIMGRSSESSNLFYCQPIDRVFPTNTVDRQDIQLKCKLRMPGSSQLQRIDCVTIVVSQLSQIDERDAVKNFVCLLAFHQVERY